MLKRFVLLVGGLVLLFSFWTQQYWMAHEDTRLLDLRFQLRTLDSCQANNWLLKADLEMANEQSRARIQELQQTNLHFGLKSLGMESMVGKAYEEYEPLRRQDPRSSRGETAVNSPKQLVDVSEKTFAKMRGELSHTIERINRLKTELQNWFLMSYLAGTFLVWFGSTLKDPAKSSPSN